MKKESKYITSLGVTETLQTRPELPGDYHYNGRYSQKFLGEIFDVEKGKYYSQAARNKYYAPKFENEKHLCPGHWQGYRYAVQNFSNPGDLVFDPTVGTGTTIVEAINHGRDAIGIELEFSSITERNIEAQYVRVGDDSKNPVILGKSQLIIGNASNLTELLKERGVEKESISLVINGTPYPKLTSISSDSPERKTFSKNEEGETIISSDGSFDYQAPDSFGLKKGDEYWEFIENMYLDCIPYMKVGGKMIIIIKDMVQNKAPYLLHEMITDHILNKTEELEFSGFFIHKHIPTTMFMNTYNKRFPDVQIPLYQTAVVLTKI